MITNNFTNSGIIILILRSTFSAFLLLVNNSKHYYNVSAFSSSTKYCRFDIVTDSTGKTLIAEEDNANGIYSSSSSSNSIRVVGLTVWSRWCMYVYAIGR